MCKKMKDCIQVVAVADCWSLRTTNGGYRNCFCPVTQHGKFDWLNYDATLQKWRIIRKQILLMLRGSYWQVALADRRCPHSVVHVVAANDPRHREGRWLHCLALPQWISEAMSSPSWRWLLLRQGTVTNKATRLGILGRLYVTLRKYLYHVGNKRNRAS